MPFESSQLHINLHPLFCLHHIFHSWSRNYSSFHYNFTFTFHFISPDVSITDLFHLLHPSRFHFTHCFDLLMYPFANFLLRLYLPTLGIVAFSSIRMTSGANVQFFQVGVYVVTESVMGLWWSRWIVFLFCQSFFVYRPCHFIH